MSCGLLRSLDDVALTIASSGSRSEVAYRKRALAARIQGYLAKHAGERLRLEDIGRAVGASASYVSEVFREVVGVPPYRYQLQLRLTRASELLRQQDDLSRLALDLGFSSHSHFTTAFRRRFGDTPGNVRMRVRRERAARNVSQQSQLRPTRKRHAARDADSTSEEQRP